MKLMGYPKTVFNDYKKTGLYLATPVCTFKCVKEAKAKGIEFVECHNHYLASEGKFIDLTPAEIYEQYVVTNPLIECIILSGLDPMDSFNATLDFIDKFRKLSNIELVIFTGYYENEIQDKLLLLKKYNNVVMKFGRYDPSQKRGSEDPIGGVTLISSNQYFKKLDDVVLN